MKTFAMTFRTLYDGKQPEISKDTSLSEFEDTLTQQHMAADCDINTIIDRHDRTGILTHENRAAPTYGDFTAVADFQASLNVVMDAQDMFMDLPAKQRERFGNDPARYIDFVLDPSNRDEAVKLGILDAPSGHSSNGSPEPLEASSDPSRITTQGVKKKASSTPSKTEE